jgi:hypothetical protein
LLTPHLIKFSYFIVLPLMPPSLPPVSHLRPLRAHPSPSLLSPS